MRVTLRAIGAVALLVGAYLLILGTLALTVLVAWKVLTADLTTAELTRTLLIWGPVTVALLRGLLPGLVVGLRPVPRRDVGVPVTPEDDARLWAEVRSLADTLGTRAPDEIRLMGEANAWVSEDSRFLGLVAGRRTMSIGVPLLLTLDREECLFVLAHELGHYSGRHTTLGGVTYRGQVALASVVARLRRRSLVRRVFAAYLSLYVRLSSAVRRRQEIEADAAGVRIFGRRAAVSALRDMEAVGHAWASFVHEYVEGEGERRPSHFLEGFGYLWMDPVRREQVAHVRKESVRRATSAYDSHPSPAERISTVGSMPDAGPDVAPSGVLGICLLEDPDPLIERLEASMFEPGLDALPLEQVLANRAFAHQRRLGEALSEVLRARGRRGGLEGALELLEHGSSDLDEVARRLLDGDGAPRPHAMAEVHELFQVLVAALVAVRLAEVGAVRFEHSWAQRWVLVDEDGERVDPWTPARWAAESRAGARELVAWLDSLGVAWRDEETAVAPSTDPVA